MPDGNPFGSMLNPNAARTGLWDMRMMSAANRMETPFERGMRGMYRGRGVSGDPMLAGLASMANEPDYSQFTFDPAMRQQAIAAGVVPLEASQVQRNVLLPNTGFFGRHPALSGALEGAIFGGAAAHGGETPGESIQGALEGMIGSKRIREGMYRQQFARPFEAAGMLEGLQDLRQKRDFQEAEIQHLRAENQKLGRPDHDMRTIGTAGPQDKYIPIFNQETGKLETQPNPNYDPALVDRMHRSPGAGTDFDRLVEMRNQERAKAGQPPLNSEQILGLRGRYMAAGVVPGEAGRQPYKNVQEAERDRDRLIAGLRAKVLKADDPKHQELIREQYYNDWTSSAMAAAASGQKAPPFQPPSTQDIQKLIDQNNQEVQSQIDTINQQFADQYPEALETPSRRRGKQTPRPGSTPETAIIIK